MDLAVDIEHKWSFSTARSLLAFCLLKQIVREFRSNCESILDLSDESDEEIEFLMGLLRDLLPEGHSFFEKRFDKVGVVTTDVLSQIFEIAKQCIEDPIRALEYSIHNSLGYFLEDYTDNPDDEPSDIKAKAIRFLFPDIIIPSENLYAYFALLEAEYKSQDCKSLEHLYLNRICTFLDDVLELRYL